MLGSNFALLVKSPGDDGQQQLTTVSRYVYRCPLQTEHTYIRPKNICDDIFTLGKFKKLLLLLISLRSNIYNPSGRKSGQSNR